MKPKLHYLDPNPVGVSAVLLLHGLGANSTSWALQFETLIAAGLRPIAPDIAGFGDSKYDGRGWSFNRVARDLVDLLDCLKITSVNVVGLSMGGVIAQQFILDFPRYVRKLVLISTFAALRPTSISQWLYFVQRFFVVYTLGLNAQSRIVSQRVFPNPDQEALRQMTRLQILSADSRAYRAAMRCLGLYNSSRRLKEIRVPTLVIRGEKDTTVLPAYSMKIAQEIPGSKLAIIPNAGHAVTIDQPDVFNALLLDFILE